MGDDVMDDMMDDTINIGDRVWLREEFRNINPDAFDEELVVISTDTKFTDPATLFECVRKSDSTSCGLFFGRELVKTYRWAIMKYD